MRRIIVDIQLPPDWDEAARWWPERALLEHVAHEAVVEYTHKLLNLYRFHKEITRGSQAQSQGQ